jgi:hypothetical protein
MATIDYMAEINKQLANNANADVSALVKARGAKIASDDSLTQYSDSQRELERLYLTGTTPETIKNPSLRTGAATAKSQGVEIDYDKIKGIYKDSLDAAYDARYAAQDRATNSYYDLQATNQGTVLDTLKKTNLGAMATGASKAAAAANQLSATLGLSQMGVDTATGLSQEYTALAEQEKADLAALNQLALTDSNANALAVGKLNTDIYGYDTSGVAARLGAYGNEYAANKGLEAQKYASDTSVDVQALANKAYGSYSSGGSGSGGTTDSGYSSIPGWDKLTTEQQRDIQLAISSGAPWEQVQAILRNAGIDPSVIGTNGPVNNADGGVPPKLDSLTLWEIMKGDGLYKPQIDLPKEKGKDYNTYFGDTIALPTVDYLSRLLQESAKLIYGSN